MKLRVALTLLLLAVPHSAFAACTSPAANEGDQIYTSVSHQMVYCNGTNWVAMGMNSAVNFGTLTTSNFCAATSGTAISCTTASTGSGSVVLSASPTLTGTVTAGTFAGSGASLTSIGTASLSGITGTPSSTTYLRGDGTWATISSGGITIASTAITSGTTTKVLYDNAGVVGEYTITGTGNVVMSASPTLTGTITAAAANFSGNVGIGTTSPSQLQHIYGSSNPAGLVEYSGSTQFSGATLQLKDNVSTSNQSRIALSQSVLDGSNSQSYFTIGQLNSSGSWVQNDAEYDENANQWYFMTGGNTRVVINSSGNVGIGTTSPASTLAVNGGMAIGTTYAASNAAGSNNIIVQGSVGIGTTIPLAAIDIRSVYSRIGVSGSNAAAYLLSNSTGEMLVGEDAGAVYLYRGFGGGGAKPLVMGSTNTYDAFYTSNNERVRIDSSGNVGIGTTGPTTALQVNGTISSTSGGFKFPDGTTQTTAARAGVAAASYVTASSGNQTTTASISASCPAGQVFIEVFGGNNFSGAPIRNTLCAGLYCGNVLISCIGRSSCSYTNTVNSGYEGNLTNANIYAICR